MPVKVRCPNCEKVLNAPDSARGKAVKCPGCETKVKVPTGDSSGGSSAKAKKKSEDSDDFLANMDLDKAIDSSMQICPKCGASIPEDAAECPKCGVDPNTGQLSAAAKKKAGRKGVDPAEFYSVALKNAWEFTTGNMKMVVRTFMYLLLFALINAGCSYMVQYCSDPPPKFFWAMCGFAASLVGPGWVWYLTIQVIQHTVGRKNDVSGVNFDIFQNMALGLTQIVWFIVFLFPITFLMYPLAMIHLSMPVTKKAWMFFALIPVFFRNIGAVLYWWIIALFTNALALGGLIAMAVLYAASLVAYITAMQAGGQKPEPQVVIWSIMGVVLVVTYFLFSFVSLFNMRVMGLLALYFKDTLDLQVLVAEKQYVRKEIPRDKFGNPIKTTQQKVAQAVLLVVVIAIVGGVGYYVYTTQFKK